MRVLNIGMLLPGMQASGEDGYIKKLSLELIKRGHQVDVLTAINSNTIKIETASEDGINYYIMHRIKPYMYQSIIAPMNEIYDEFAQMQFMDFLKTQEKNKVIYDIIIYHSMYPLSLVEIAKKYTGKLIIVMHGTYIINPLHHTYSALKIMQNPYQCLRPEAFDYKHYTKEYLALTNNTFNDYTDLIEKQMKDRMAYGKYLLEDVADSVISNGYFGLHAYLDFGVKPDKIRIIENPVNNILTDEAIHFAQNKYTKSYDVYEYAFLSNWQYMKGQHILVQAAKKLPATSNIEIALYGEMNINPEYKERIADFIINNNLKKKVKLKGRYTKEQIKDIFKSIYIHVNPQAWDIGQTGTFYETLMNGIMQIWTPSAHHMKEIEFKDAYYEGKDYDKNLYKLYEFELKYAPKPNYKLKDLYYNKLKDYIFKCGDATDLVEKIKNSVGKEHFREWLLLAQERERTVHYTYDEFIDFTCN